ncbi:MAG: formate/nitrite transporter family protein [Bacilli bacterium]
MEKLLSPVEIAKYTIATGEAKVKKRTQTVLISSFFSGAFIAFGALCSLAVAYALYGNNSVGIETYGFGKLAQGIIFIPGLVFVLFLGTDLFTGNCLVFMAFLDKKIGFTSYLKNISLVWIGNLIGATVVGYFIYKSGIFEWSNNLFGGVLLKTGYAKTHIDFSTGFYSGIVCNWIVCLIILATYSTKDMSAKLIITILGILIFVASGSEHVVANMGYLSGAFFAKINPDMVAMSGKSAVAIGESLGVKDILINNFVPVTLGNIVGGSVFVATIYYFMIKDKIKK